jgi:hypothetical protein
MYPIFQENKVYLLALNEATAMQILPDNELHSLAAENSRSIRRFGYTQSEAVKYFNRIRPAFNSNYLFIAYEIRKQFEQIRMRFSIPKKFAELPLSLIPVNILQLVAWRSYRSLDQQIRLVLRQYTFPQVEYDKVSDIQGANGSVSEDEEEEEEEDFDISEPEDNETEQKISSTELETPVMTSYDAYQYWYAREQAMKDAKAIEPISIAVKNDRALVSDFQASLCSQLEDLPPGKFRHKHPEHFYALVSRGRGIRFERQPLEHLILSKKHYTTLCQIMFPIMRSHNVRMKSVVKLVESLGGSVKETTGSVDQVFIPVFGTRSTVWHGNHGSRIQKIGLNVAIGVRQVLVSFKIDPLDFDFQIFQKIDR